MTGKSRSLTVAMLRLIKTTNRHIIKMRNKPLEKYFLKGATLVTIGGDHGIPIPIMRALDVFDEKISLIQVDAHIDWRDEINERD